jgi:hypothetical protein
MNNNLINFNYNYYIDDIDLIDNEILLNNKNYIEYKLINKFNYSNKINSLIISKLLYNLDIFFINKFNK